MRFATYLHAKWIQKGGTQPERRGDLASIELGRVKMTVKVKENTVEYLPKESRAMFLP